MAEENLTTDSSSTTEAPAAETPSPTPTADTSTTEPTLLTPAPEGETPEAEQPAADEPNPLFGAPEGEYEIVGLPEGMTIDKEALGAFEPIAKELGLSNEGMSKIAGAYAEKILPQIESRVVEALQNDIVAQQAAWANDTIERVKTDPVFEGKALPEVQAIAAKALDRFAGEDFRKFLQDTGLGNNPEMMKFAYLAGSAIAEDTTFERGGTAPTTKSRTEKYYGPQT